MSPDLKIDGKRRGLNVAKWQRGNGTGGLAADKAPKADRADDRDKSGRGKAGKGEHRPRTPEGRLARSLKLDPRSSVPSDRAHLKNAIEKYAGQAFGTKAPLKQGLARIEETIDRLTSPPGDPASRKTLEDIKDLFRERPTHVARILEDMAGNLDERAPDTGAFGNPANRKALFQEIIQKIAHPDKIFQGGGTSDCGPAVVQSILANAHPLRYYEMAKSLMLEGSFALGKGGTPFEANPKAIPYPGDPNTWRTSLDTLIQRSLSNFAKENLSKGGPEFGGTADATAAGGNPLRPSGSRARPPRGTGGTGTYGGLDDDGLTANQIRGLLNTVLTDGQWKGLDLDKMNPRRRLGAWHALKKRVKPEKKSADGAVKVDPEQLGVPVGVFTKSGSFHEVLVKRVARGKVYYFDPATGSREKMNEKDFLASVSQMLLPKDQPIDLRGFDFRPRRRPVPTSVD